MADVPDPTEEIAAEAEKLQALIDACDQILDSLNLETDDYDSLSDGVEKIVKLNITDIDKLPRETVDRIQQLVKRTRQLEREKKKAEGTNGEESTTETKSEDSPPEANATPPDEQNPTEPNVKPKEEKPKPGYKPSPEDIAAETARREAEETAAQDRHYHENEQGIQDTIEKHLNDIRDGRTLSNILGVSTKDSRSTIARAYARYTSDLNRYIGVYQPLKNFQSNANTDERRRYLKLYETAHGLLVSLNVAFDALRNGQDPYIENQSSKTDSGEKVNERKDGTEAKSIQEKFKQSLTELQNDPAVNSISVLWGRIRSRYSEDQMKGGGGYFYADYKNLKFASEALQNKSEFLSDETLDRLTNEYHTPEMQAAFRKVATRELQAQKDQVKNDLINLGLELTKEAAHGFTNFAEVMKRYRNPELQGYIDTLRSQIMELTTVLYAASYQELLTDWSESKIQSRVPESPFKTAVVRAALVEVAAQKNERASEETASMLQNTDWEEALEMFQARKSENKEFARLAQGMSALEATYLSKAKQQFWDRNPNSVPDSSVRVILQEEPTFFNSVSDPDTKAKLRSMFSNWASDQTKDWADEVDSLRSEFKSAFQETLSRSVTAYAERIVSEPKLDALLDQQKKARFRDNIVKQTMVFITEAVASMEANKISGTAIQRQIELLASDPRFNESQIKSDPARELHTINERASTNGQGYSPEILRVLLGAHVTLKREQKIIERSLGFAFDTKPLTTHSTDQILVGSELPPVTYFGEPPETLHLARQKNNQASAEAVMLTRMHLRDSAVDDPASVERRKKQQSLNLQHAVYLSRGEQMDNAAMDRAIQDAITSMLELGYTQADLDAISTNLELSTGQESLVRLVTQLLQNADGQVDFFDPNLFSDKQPEAADEITNYSSIRTRGFFSGRQLERDFDNKDRRSNFIDIRVAQVTRLLNEETIHYDLSGFIDNKPSALNGRLDRTGLLATRDLQYNWIQFKIGNCLTESDKEELLNLARDEKNSAELIKKHIQVKLKTSEIIKSRVSEMNAATSALAKDAAADPTAFLEKIGMGDSVKADRLTVADWYSIFFTILRGQFDQSDKSPYLVRGSAESKTIDDQTLLEPALLYGKNLVTNATEAA